MAAQRANIRLSIQRSARAVSQATINRRLFKQVAPTAALPVSIPILLHPHVQVAQRDIIRRPQLNQAARVVRRDTILRFLVVQQHVFRPAKQAIILLLKPPHVPVVKLGPFNR